MRTFSLLSSCYIFLTYSESNRNDRKIKPSSMKHLGWEISNVSAPATVMYKPVFNWTIENSLSLQAPSEHNTKSQSKFKNISERSGQPHSVHCEWWLKFVVDIYMKLLLTGFYLQTNLNIDVFLSPREF